MKEIIVIIRPAMAEATKKALEAVGLPAFTGRKSLRQGKSGS